MRRSGKEMVCLKKCVTVVSPEQSQLFYIENSVVQQIEP